MLGMNKPAANQSVYAANQSTYVTLALTKAQLAVLQDALRAASRESRIRAMFTDESVRGVEGRTADQDRRDFEELSM